MPFRRCFLRLSQQLCTAGVYSGEYLPQPLDLGTRVVPQGQQTGVRQRQLQRQVPCRRKGRVFHRAQKHAAPGKQIVVNTLVVFHHVPAWCEMCIRDSGKGEQITEGSDIAIIATGLMVNEARMAAEQLAAEGIHARVINIHTIKPLDEEIVLKAAKECGKVITAEEHNVIGGLGEAVCAVLSEKLPTPVRRVGVQDVFGCSGPAWDLLKFYGLDAATICKTAHEMLGK